MAIRTTCGQCSKSFTAQEEYVGKKVKCPGCGARIPVTSEEERRREESRREEKARWAQEQEARIRLIEERDSRPRSVASLAVEFGTGVRPVRNYNPGALTRFRKLRALSRFMILVAYLLLALMTAGIGVTLYLFRDGTIAGPGVLAICCLGWLLLGIFAFSVFKFLGELSWLLADLGDHQLDVRNLLLDLREDLQRSDSGIAPQ